MYTPPAFQEDDRDAIQAMMRAARLSTLVTATAEGLMATPLQLFLDEAEGEFGTLYGHLAKANPQWRTPASAEAMVIFNGPDAYVTPSFYASKVEHGKVVPTWNYAAVHAYGTAEFFQDTTRLHEVVSRLTGLHEQGMAQPWSVSDAPEPFVAAQLKGIVGLRLPIARIDAKRKMNQNRSGADRLGVASGLMSSAREEDRAVAAMIPIDGR